MTTILVLLIFIAFIVKHFICDFPLQAFPYQYTNKGTYGHPGGLLHSGIHVVGTLIVLLLFVPSNPFILAIALLDGFIHYHVDWAKMNINKKYGWGPMTSDYFWTSLGVDQMLHYLTYAGIVYALMQYAS